MKALLNNAWAPVTHHWGFFEAPLDSLSATFDQWFRSLWPTTVSRHFNADLSCALASLEPLNLPKSILVQTASKWTAVFSNAIGGPSSSVAHIAKTHHCRGLFVACVEDAYDTRTHTGTWGSIQFCTYAPHPTDGPLNDERTIYLVNDCGKWEFGASGPAFAFERTDRYKSRRTRDRFTCEMLEEYCAALGIQLFDERFYGPTCALFEAFPQLPASVQAETYEMRRKMIGMR